MHENPAFPRHIWCRFALLEYYGALALLPEPTVRSRADTLLEMVGLADAQHEPIARFSKGMIQRLALRPNSSKTIRNSSCSMSPVRVWI